MRIFKFYQNKTLKELHDVQEQIKQLREEKDKVSIIPPRPIDINKRYGKYRFPYHGLMYRDSNIEMLASDLARVIYGTQSVEQLLTNLGEQKDYLKELGQFLINFSDYSELHQNYDKQINELVEKQRELKQQLNID